MAEVLEPLELDIDEPFPCPSSCSPVDDGGRGHLRIRRKLQVLAIMKALISKSEQNDSNTSIIFSFPRIQVAMFNIMATDFSPCVNRHDTYMVFNLEYGR